MAGLNIQSALVIGGVILALAFVFAAISLVIFLWRRRRSQRRSTGTSTRNYTRGWSLSHRHKRDPSDASRLMPLLNPSDLSHDVHTSECTRTRIAHQQPYGQADYMRPCIDPVTSAAPAPSVEPSATILPNSRSPPLTTRRIQKQRLDVTIPDPPSVHSAENGSVRQLPPLPIPSPSELDFHLSRHLPSLFIPSTPYPDSPLASSIRLTPGPMSLFSPDNYINRSQEQDSPPSIYSQKSADWYDRPEPEVVDQDVLSPSTQNNDMVLSRLNTMAISRMLQHRAKAARRMPSRTSSRSTSRLRRPNFILRAKDVAEDVEDSELSVQSTGSTDMSAILAEPSSLTDITRNQTPEPRTSNRKRSRSGQRTRRRLLPPTPSGSQRGSPPNDTYTYHSPSPTPPTSFLSSSTMQTNSQHSHTDSDNPLPDSHNDQLVATVAITAETRPPGPRGPRTTNARPRLPPIPTDTASKRPIAIGIAGRA